MVRVSKLRDDLTSSLQGHIRRVYPIIQGPNNWGNIVENREKYFNDKNKFPLVQEPLIERFHNMHQAINQGLKI